MATQLEAQAKAADTLITNTRALEAKLVEAKSKKDTLKARAKSAAASKAVSDMVQGLNTSNAAVAFERMEEKVLALEGEAEATAALSAPDDVDRRFAALEGGGVDDDLARMKAGLALGSGRSGPAGALPEGRAGGAAAIDVELEELRRKAAE
jgi:phage shock protein A